MTQQDHIDDFLTIVNPNFWANLDGLTIDQAAALSVGIDPDQLDMLRELQRSDQMDEEEEPVINFGAKQSLYYQNKDLIKTAIRVGALHLVSGLLPYQKFHAWATTKGLSLPNTPSVAPQANDAIDVFLRDFLGADYQDYPRLKLAILGAKQYATGQVKTQQEVVEYLTTVTGNGQARSEEAKEKIAYVAQPDSRGRPGRSGVSVGAERQVVGEMGGRNYSTPLIAVKNPAAKPSAFGPVWDEQAKRDEGTVQKMRFL